MHAILSYHGNRRTNIATPPQTGPITIHCAAASAQCKNTEICLQNYDDQLAMLVTNNNNNESISTAQNKKSSDAPAGIKSFQFLCKCLNRARPS